MKDFKREDYLDLLIKKLKESDTIGANDFWDKEEVRERVTYELERKRFTTSKELEDFLEKDLSVDVSFSPYGSFEDFTESSALGLDDLAAAILYGKDERNRLKDGDFESALALAMETIIPDSMALVVDDEVIVIMIEERVGR